MVLARAFRRSSHSECKSDVPPPQLKAHVPIAFDLHLCARQGTPYTQLIPSEGIAPHFVTGYRSYLRRVPSTRPSDRLMVAKASGNQTSARASLWRQKRMRHAGPYCVIDVSAVKPLVDFVICPYKAIMVKVELITARYVNEECIVYTVYPIGYNS